MRLVQTLIANVGFRDPAFNEERLTVIGDLVRLTQRVEADLLVLPAGVITATNEDEAPQRIAEVADLADSAGIAIAGGVDVADAPAKSARRAKTDESVDDLVERGLLPFFGFVVGGDTPPGMHRWRQASTTAANATLVDESRCPGAERVITIAGRRVGILICGELFSRNARERLAAERPGLILDIGHSGMGQGLIPAMRNLATTASCPVAHAQHLASWWGRSLHFVVANGAHQPSAVEPDNVIEGDRVWAAWAVRGEV